jgi:hypothetical protein
MQRETKIKSDGRCKSLGNITEQYFGLISTLPIWEDYVRDCCYRQHSIRIASATRKINVTVFVELSIFNVVTVIFLHPTSSSLRGVKI